MLATIAMGLLILGGISLVWVLIRTMQGNLLDRRLIFMYIGMAVALPLFLNIPPPLAETQEVTSLVDGLKKLTPGSKVLLSCDFDPQSAPELQPMAVAFFKYAFMNDIDVIMMGLWPAGPQQGNQAIETALEVPEIKAKNPVYGVDYVNLGFQSGNEFVIQTMGQSFKQKFPTDVRRTPYDSIPLLQNVVNFSNVDYVFVLSSGRPGSREWVQYAADRFGITLGTGNTAVQTPEMYPYWRGGQMKGLIGGMAGAAEFEKQLNVPAKATSFLLSQSFAHATVMALIIIGNLGYFAGRRREQSGGKK